MLELYQAQADFRHMMEVTETLFEHLATELHGRTEVEFRGARYIHIHVPCPLGWGSNPADTIKLARLAVESGLFPLFEAEHGAITRATKIRNRVPVDDYLRPQKRFAHLFGTPPDTARLARIQAAADRTIISTNFATGGNAHSEFLGPLAEQGIPGMLIVIALIAVTMWTAVRLWLRMPAGLDKRMVGAALFGLTTYYVHGTLNNFLDLDKASVPFWGFTAMLVVMDLKYPAGGKRIA